MIIVVTARPGSSAVSKYTTYKQEASTSLSVTAGWLWNMMMAW